MIRLHHAPIEVDGHKFLVDIPFLSSREEYEKWYKKEIEYLRSLIKEGK